MAKARAVVKRRKAISNIKKITRTMQLIATSKFQKALRRATATKPYTEKLAELVTQVSRVVPKAEHPLLSVHGDSATTALLVISSNRGLCGGYNARLLGAALAHIQEVERDKKLARDVSGKKGIAYFGFLGRGVNRRYTDLDDRVRFHEVAALADEFIELYGKRKLDAVHVAYMRFISVARQVPEVTQLLPVRRPDGETGVGQQSPIAEMESRYDFSPEPDILLADLLPAAVRTRLFQCFTDAAASEQIARMVAMKAATDAATDMIKILTQTYNRARQTQITMELLDIIGGSESLRL